ncbi:MAG: asparaginase [Candidatus Magasanikbacteria bacterium CG10_big_fil_rev_8_21_14_0_10_42_10]|uniref:Asparaginase n=2 Tax=Candidatus Magasanikiibacteriota TaxID=1752731 RepID=A0A2H0TWQ2_9BACT|nr:MAG: asparaginase [Candidatus Magasanikbacteria bacterium CG10_big_fil_rev_8_21_14_0_10_42_10]PIZ92670.1 MAG: asparaginase [Candidatus Magasanikbacteria bacterium CG_4_10_14_0_2_um_filter_41_10]
MNIKLFVTGGTFDKEYDELTGELVFHDTHIQDMLQKGRSKVDIDIRTLMMVDSLHITREDRHLILDHCQKTDAEKILITHGTDTMVETAQLLASHITDKTIVLTGAMIPYTFGSSDGLFNLGSALAFTQTLEYGVYIAMNGRYFQWSNVQKNKKTGVFEEL